MNEHAAMYTQAAGGLKICGYYAKWLAIREGRHSYMPAIALGSGNRAFLIPGLKDPKTGAILTGDKSTSLIMRQRSLYI